MKKITYRKEGDYLIPNLAIKGAESDYHIRVYEEISIGFI